jgi:hypothetical protein
MKKFFLLMFMSLCSVAVMADMPINFGIHAGTSLNRIKFKDLSQIKESKENVGYMIGGFARINLGKCYIEPALNFAHKASTAEIKKTDTDRGGNVNIEMNTVDVPIMVGWKFINLAVAKVRFYLGPQFSVGSIKNLKRLTQESIDEDKVTVRGKVGLGVDVGNLTFDLDVEKGVKEMSNELKAPRSFNLTIGFKFI